MSLDWGNKVYIFDESLYFYDCVFYNRNLDKTKAMCKKTTCIQRIPFYNRIYRTTSVVETV